MSFQPIQGLFGSRFGIDQGCSFLTISTVNCPLAIFKRTHPQSLQISMTERIQRTQTMGGHVEEHWPADLDSLRAEALTGGFFVLDPSLVRNKKNNFILESALESDGLATSRRLQPYRRYTEPSLNAMDLEERYRTNGAKYNQDGQIYSYYPVEIRILNFVFLGYFTAFSVSHNVEQLNMYQIGFDFKIQRLIVRSDFSAISTSELARLGS